MSIAHSIAADLGSAAIDAPLLEIDGLTLDIDKQGKDLRLLHGVDLRIHRGDSLGIVGESGCGKSVTWLALMRVLGRSATLGGQVRYKGKDFLGLNERELTQIRGKRIAMIFQDASSCLNPVRTIGGQLVETLVRHRGLAPSAARQEAKRLLDRVRVAESRRRLDQFPHELSGGMNQRVMIAIALAGEPELLVADEPTTALDVTVQAQILNLLDELRRETGMALVLISHDLAAIATTCDRTAVMYAGRVIETGPTAELLRNPGHPYTKGLVGSIPDMDGPVKPLIPIPGQVPSPAKLPSGCAFAPRCTMASDVCGKVVPLSMKDGEGRAVVCFHPVNSLPHHEKALAEAFQ